MMVGVMPRLTGRRPSVLAMAAALTVLACQAAAQLPSTDSSPSSADPTAMRTPATFSPADAPSAAPSPSLSPREAYDAALNQQATRYLDRWDQIAAGAPSNAVVLVGELTRGGGWRGANADNAKSAVEAGAIQATVKLPMQAPPGEVVWPDGSTQTVSLFSAAEALSDIISHKAGGDCHRCRPVKVIGAELVSGEADTSRGRATMPLWQFEFAPEDAPRTPITHPATRDRIVAPLEEPWDPYGGNPMGQRIDAAYGTPAATMLTVIFVGAPLPGNVWCGADYTAEGIESDRAVVVIVRSESHPPSGEKPSGCFSLGAGRNAGLTLERPVGTRTILEVQFGTPVVLIAGDPPKDLVSR